MGFALQHAQKDPKTMSSGSKPISLSINRSTLAGSSRKRLHSTLADDSGSDDDQNAGPQLLTGFDRSTGKAITENEEEEKQPLVISRQKNRDWRADAARKRGKNLLPAEEQARRAGKDVEIHPGADEEEEKPTYGLLVTQRSAEERNGTSATAELDTKTSQETKPKTADEEAMDALLGNHNASSGLVIPNATPSGDSLTYRQSEGDMFKSDVEARPDVPSLADYAAVPIEEFGKALMRGMGWKEGDELGRAKSAASKPREVKRRPALLGIGAKEAPKGLEELGAWGNGAKKTRRIDTSYMPLVMQNSKTGEKLTEEELMKKKQENVAEDQQAQHRDPDNRMERRHRDRDNHNRDSSSSRRHERENSSSRKSRTDDYRERDRDRDRKSRRHDYDSSDRRRDRDHDSRRHNYTERRRRHEERGDRERDREHRRDRERNRN